MIALLLLPVLVVGFLAAAYLNISMRWCTASPDAVPAPVPLVQGGASRIEDMGHCASRRLDEVHALEALYRLPSASPTGTEIS